MTQTANIIIKNNTIDHGVYSSGTSNSTYTYDHCLWTYGSSIIEGNTLLNPGASANMINTSDGSNSIIRDNIFGRNDTSINAYINHHYDVGHAGILHITDNVFDSPTIDGSDENLVIGLNVGSIYTRNKNQKGKLFIPIYDTIRGGFLGTLDKFDIGSAFGFTMNRKTEDTANSLITNFTSASVSTPAAFTIKKSFHIGDYLEKGMQVSGVRLGGYRVSGNITDFDVDPAYNFGVRLKVHEGSDNMDAAQYALIEPKTIQLWNWGIYSDIEFSELSVATQYTILDSTSPAPSPPGNYYGFSLPDYYTAGNGYQLELEFYANITFTTSVWSMNFTPIEITYTW